jgi:Collagen triple helix repeat (20 copies)
MNKTLFSLLLAVPLLGYAEEGGHEETGPQGQQGAQGPKGDPGSNGHNGTNGTPGAAGSQGVAGDKGSTGDTGAIGPQGTSADVPSIDPRLGVEVREYDSKHWSISSSASFGMSNSTARYIVEEKLTLKLGRSYEERRIDELERKLAR